MRIWVLFGDILFDRNTTILGVYTTYDKYRHAFYEAIESGFFNVRSEVRILDEGIII